MNFWLAATSCWILPAFVNNSLEWPLAALVSGSLSAQLFKHLFVDLSGALYFGIGGVQGDFHLRVGPGFALMDRRDESGKGWRILLTGLAGYRYLLRQGEGDGHEGSEVDHCLSFAGAMEPEYMFRRSMGINFRLLAGASVPVAQSFDGLWGTDRKGFSEACIMDYSLDIVVSIGLTL